MTRRRASRGRGRVGCARRPEQSLSRLRPGRPSVFVFHPWSGPARSSGEPGSTRQPKRRRTMTSSISSSNWQRAAVAALAGLAGLHAVAANATTTASRVNKRCAALQRRAEGRLRHTLDACGKSGTTLAILRCAHDKRSAQGSTLTQRGCASPWWAVSFTTRAVGKDELVLSWRSKTNWARLLDRDDDPIASTIRQPDGRFENLLVLDRQVDVATITAYIEDVEGRPADVTGSFFPGLPGQRDGVRGAFPIPTGGDRSVDETVSRMNDVIASCHQTGGTPYGASMFAEGTTFHQAMEGVKSSANNSKDFSAEPGGNHGQAY